MTWSNYRASRPRARPFRVAPQLLRDMRRTDRSRSALGVSYCSLLSLLRRPGPTLLHVCMCACQPHTHGPFVCVSPQEFLSDREHGQARLSTVAASGELLTVVVSKDRVDGIKAKVSNAREDWKSLMNHLQTREDALQVWVFPSRSGTSSFLYFNLARQPDPLDIKFGKCFIFQSALAFVAGRRPLRRRVEGRR